MQIRKLVKSGLSSYTVALPKDWVERNKLKRGDLVYINEKGEDKLVISSYLGSSSKDRETKQIVISTDKKSIQSLIREIRYAYLNDYKQILVKGKDLSKYRKEIKKQIYELVALEIIEESSEKVISRSFLNDDEVAPLKAIKRIDNIVRSMFSDTIETIIGEDLSEVITERDHEVNRLVFLVFKIVISGLKSPRIKQVIGLESTGLMQCWTVCFHLEKIGDELKRTARILGEMNKRKEKFRKKDLYKLFEDVKKFYVDMITALYKKDVLKSDEGKPKQQSLSGQCEDYFVKNRSINVSEVSGMLKAIISHSNDISKISRYLAD